MYEMHTHMKTENYQLFLSCSLPCFVFYFMHIISSMYCLSAVESERRQMEVWPTAWWEMDWLLWQMKSTWPSAPPWSLLTAFPPVWPLRLRQQTSQHCALKPPLPLSSHSASHLTPWPLAPCPILLSHSQPSHRKPRTTRSSKGFFQVTTKPFPRTVGLWCLHPRRLLLHWPRSQPRSCPLCLLVPVHLPRHCPPQCCRLLHKAT